MSDFTSYPRQNAFKSTLASEIADSSTLTWVLNDAPSFTLSGANRCYIVVDWDNNKREVGLIQTISGATLTLESRGIADYEGGASTAQTHSAGAKVIITDNWNTFKAIADAIASKADIAGETFTGPVDFSGTTNSGLRFNNLTTAQRNALTAVNGMVVYDTDIGELYQYIGGAWSAVSAGSTQPNASTTVAGKVEQATASEIAAATELGATGAPLFINPVNTAKTSAGAGDEDKLPVLNASGQLAAGFLDLTAKTDKSTLTTKGDIYVATAASTPARLAVGATNGHALVVDATEVTGLKYAPILTLGNKGHSQFISWPVPSGFFSSLVSVSAGSFGLAASSSVSPATGAGPVDGLIDTAISGATGNLPECILEFVMVVDGNSSDVDFNFGFCGTATGDFQTAYNSAASGSCVLVSWDGSANTLYAKVKTGTSLTNSSLSAGLSQNTRVPIRIHYKVTTVDFYVNNTLAATVSTNVPTFLLDGASCFIGAGKVEVSATGSTTGFKMLMPVLSVKTV